MKRLFVCAILAMSVLTGLAAADGAGLFDSPLDRSDERFIRVEETFTGDPIVADYVQTRTIGRLGRSLESSGRMIVRPGYGIAWQTMKPYASLMVVGRSTMFQQVGTRMVQMDVSGNLVYLAMAQAIESVFSGDFSQVDTVFDAFFIENDGKWVIGLVPVDETIASFVGSITITGDRTLESVTMVETSGDSILYEFENVEMRELESDENALFEI